MSDAPNGPGWWLASDGKWYPPETHPSAATPATSPDPADPQRDLPAGGSGLPARAWRKYRGLPLWAQIVGALVLLVAVTAPFSGSDYDKEVSTTPAASEEASAATATTAKPTTTTEKATTTTEKVTTTTAAPTTTTAPPPPPTTAPPPPDPFAGESVSQSNARRSAGDYLDFTAFSRSGLIEQLEYEGFSEGDATYAVDSLNVDWNEQAANSAAGYLAFTSFSRSGLVEQLVYEGFSQAQAEYGVSTTGL